MGLRDLNSGPHSGKLFYLCSHLAYLLLLFSSVIASVCEYIRIKTALLFFYFFMAENVISVYDEIQSYQPSSSPLQLPLLPPTHPLCHVMSYFFFSLCFCTSVDPSGVANMYVGVGPFPGMWEI